MQSSCSFFLVFITLLRFVIVDLYRNYVLDVEKIHQYVVEQFFDINFLTNHFQNMRLIHFLTGFTNSIDWLQRNFLKLGLKFEDPKIGPFLVVMYEAKSYVSERINPQEKSFGTFYGRHVEEIETWDMCALSLLKYRRRK